MLNFNYDKNFTSNYVCKQLEESPFVNMMNVSFKAITFTKNLFFNFPKLFDDNASSLFYIECCGRTIKLEYLYLIFENLLTNSNDNIVKAYLNNIPLYCVNQDSILQWCRYLQDTHKFVIFEPVFGTNNNVLKTFLSNGKHFQFKRLDLSIDKIKPLCVTNVGENIADLMIYIAYVFNFLIYCSPYKFNEVETGSSNQLFMESINNYFNTCYTKLITKGNYNGKKFNTLDDLYNDISNIRYFDESEVKTIFKDITNVQRICEIRNRILKRSDELLNVSCGNQNAITIDSCYKKFIEIIRILFELVLKHNYFANIYSKFEKFNFNDFNYHELNLLTQYAISGGNYNFVIDENEYYSCNGDSSTLKDIPYISKQRLQSKIYKSIICGNKPFTSSNVYLEIISGYVAQKFEEYQNDVIDHSPILIDDEELSKFKNLDKIINALYLNAKFSLVNNDLVNCLQYLLKNKQFNEQYKSILYLAYLFKILYNDNFSSQYLSAYILSFLPEYLSLYMYRQNKGTLSKFNYLMFFAANHKEINIDRVHKLRNLAMSILFVNNNRYSAFVNKQVDIITKVITQNSFILQPYVISTRSNLHIAAIGGISLSNKFVNTNPFTRGFFFVNSTQGNSENINNFYKFVKNIIDPTLIKILEKSKRDKSDSYLRENLNTAYEMMLYDGKLPNLLSNYIIDIEKGTFIKKTTNYFTELITSNNIPIYKLLLTYSFYASRARDSQQDMFYCRKLNKDKTITKPYMNTMLIDNKRIPCSIVDRGVEHLLPRYDYMSDFSEFNLSFVNLRGYKLLEIYTNNNELVRNNLFYIFTRLNIFEEEREKYIFETNIESPDTAIRNYNEIPNTPHTSFKTNRMLLNGADKKPIPNVN